MTRLILGLLLLITLLAGGTTTAFAQAPVEITGTVQSVEIFTSENGETIVSVTLLDENGNTHEFYLSLETAISLGLVTADPISGDPMVTNGVIDSEISFDPSLALPEPEAEEENQHPVGSALNDFFNGLLGVDYDTIMESHDNGFGFGVIAQALWLTNQIGGDTETYEALLEAKRTGDYSNITLADGSTPDNWGDVVKSLKQGENLGAVMSNKEDKKDNAGNGLQKSNNGNGQGGLNSQGQGGNGNNPPGQGHDKNNNGKGKDKDKGKGNGN